MLIEVILTMAICSFIVLFLSVGVSIIEVIFTIRRSLCNKFAADDEIDIEEANFKNQQD